MVNVRWTGAAGIEITEGTTTILIDPLSLETGETGPPLRPLGVQRGCDRPVRHRSTG